MKWILLALTLVDTTALAAAESPSVSDVLSIEREEPLEDGAGVRLTLRNLSRRTITAWSILYEAGTPAGLVKHASSSRDAYHRLPFQEDGEDVPLAPGQATTQDIPIPGVDLSPDRFAAGNYAVYSGRVSAVFFENGDVIGDDEELIQTFIARRVNEVASTIRLRDRLVELEASLGDGERILAAVSDLVTTAEARERSADPVVVREQSAWHFALENAKYMLMVAEQVGPREALSKTLNRLDMVIDNGLRNLPASEREVLQ